jgi:[ribosomal protein S5]-alanine N-acetyltransferase
MQYTALPETSHELVALRPIASSDIPAWFAYLSLPQVYEHTSWNLQSASDLMPFVWGTEPTTPSSRLRLAIVNRVSNQLVGTAGFHTVLPEHGSAEIAYDLSPTYWGKGLATHICTVLKEWGHIHAGLVRVQATVLESNLRSVNVLERCGFQREGLLRSYRMVRGRPGNFFMYSHLPEHPRGA